MSQEIRFGTDGWRAVIAEGFTVPNVRRVAEAVSGVLEALSREGKRPAGRTVLVGHDWRFLSERFARAAAETFAERGFSVKLLDHAATSPLLSFGVKALKARIGVMITASHNPPSFNGFKIKDAYGGPAEDAFVRRVEESLGTEAAAARRGEVRSAGLLKPYARHLASLVKLARILKSPFRLAVDCMHGPAGPVLEELFGRSSRNVAFLRRRRDPAFGGANPEPIEKNLSLLQETARRLRAPGLAFDGDADRLGVVDEKGRYLPPHTVFPLLVLHAIENRRWTGGIVETVSMGYLPERIARHFKLPFREVPVGFKHVSSVMIRERVLAGGEESGGYGFGTAGPERDGILCGLLLLEYAAARGKPVHELVDELESRFGKSRFIRRDFHPEKPVADRTAWTQSVSKRVAGSKTRRDVKEMRTQDGVKIVLGDDSWLLLRPSGTEPLIRIYSEAPETPAAEKLLAWGEELCGFKKAEKTSQRPKVKSKK